MQIKNSVIISGDLGGVFFWWCAKRTRDWDCVSPTGKQMIDSLSISAPNALLLIT